jgi:hypothetical protein
MDPNRQMNAAWAPLAAYRAGGTAVQRTVHSIDDCRRFVHGRKDIAMEPRIKVITLGVNDLEKSLAFYRDGLGMPTQGIIGTEFEDGAVVFFKE